MQTPIIPYCLLLYMHSVLAVACTGSRRRARGEEADAASGSEGQAVEDPRP